jgi:hypothetical protein
MTTDVIDISLHTSTIPTTYTGPGTVVGNTVSSAGVDNEVSGHFTSTGNATQIDLGFRPLEVTVFNETDGLEWEWKYGMAATHTIKTTFTGPVIATDTTSAITVTDGGSGNWTVLFSAALCGTSKNIIFEIDG